MRRSDFRLAAIMGIVLGLIFLAAGVFAQMYSTIHWLARPRPEFMQLGVFVIEHPYQKYALGLLVLGRVFMEGGLAFCWGMRQEGKESTQPREVPPKKG